MGVEWNEAGQGRHYPACAARAAVAPQHAAAAAIRCTRCKTDGPGRASTAPSAPHSQSPAAEKTDAREDGFSFRWKGMAFMYHYLPRFNLRYFAFGFTFSDTYLPDHSFSARNKINARVAI